jgi:hypothetical protein
MTSGDYLRLEDMFTNEAKKNKKGAEKILETYDLIRITISLLMHCMIQELHEQQA